MTANLNSWALPQLSRLLPLDEDSLKQIITYTDTLPKEGAAEHLKNLLGDSPQAFEFISSFNNRRQPPPAAQPPKVNTLASAQPPAVNTLASASSSSEVPRARPRQAKKKANIHNLPARQVQDYGSVGGAYVKRDEDDYMAGSSRQRKKEPQLATALALQDKPDAVQLPIPRSTTASRTVSPKPPPSASGPLISDSLPASTKTSRTSSPAPAKTKINISGGTAMHGASTTLSDLDSAIKSLELQTNPSLTASANTAAETAKRRCTCMATRHPLLNIAPNCMNCGKIICVKEGLGPCTFCGSPILSSEDINSMVRILKDERGKERQVANNAAHKRAEVTVKPRAFTGRDFLSSTSATASPLSSAPASDNEGDTSSVDRGAAIGSGGLTQAKEHRDRLLNFQSQNAKRTRVHDEAADFDVPVSGTNMWASPQERALQLKRQQKVLREMEWNSKPDWEKRKMVASIDIVGGKAVRRMVEAERPAEEEPEQEGGEDDWVAEAAGDKKSGGGKGGAFSNNPLMGALIRPVARADKGKGTADGEQKKKQTWRRVQDDNDDNEQWILDGGAYGGRIEGRVLGAEEHAVGS